MTNTLTPDVEELVRSLSREDRLILALRYAEELTTEEIACVLRHSPRYIDGVLARIRAAVAREVRPDDRPASVVATIR